MGNLIIKGKGGAGNKLIIQDQAGGAVLTTGDSGATVANSTLTTPTIANMANCTFPAGHVIQHQYSVMGSDPSTTSTTFVTTGFSQAITLSNASNKVLITIAASCSNNTSGAYYFWDVEGTTSGFLSGDADRTGNGLGRIQNSAGTTNGWLVINLINLPGTTSPQTYTLHHHVSAGTAWVNTNSCKGHINLFEIKV